MKPGLKIPPILLEGDEPAPAAGRGLGQKFALASGPSPDESKPPELPAHYGTGKLLLEAPDPHHLYAHWDPDEGQQLWFDALIPKTQALLRVHPEGAAQSSEQITLDKASRSAFVKVSGAGQAYVAEVGFYELDGQWRALGKSLAVATPAETLAPARQPQFATFTPGLPPRATHVAEPGKPAEPESALPDSPAISDELKLPARTPVEPAPSQPVPQPIRMWLAAQETTPPAPGAVAPQSALVTANEAQQQVLREAGAWRGNGEGESAAEWERRLAALQLNPLSSMEAAALELPRPNPAEAAVTSPMVAEQQPHRGFWLKVDAELVIYGATEPGAKVTLGGQPIELREDGTFSLRLAFPDGLHAVAVHAESPQGESREAKLVFVRSTESGS